MEKKNNRKKAAVIIVVILLLLIIGVLIFLLTKKQEETEGYTINEGNYQQIQEDMESEVREGYFETYMNTDWTFPDGTSET